MEAVLRVGVEDQVARLARPLQGRAHGVHVLARNALVQPAVEAEHGRLELGDLLQGPGARVVAHELARLGRSEAAVPGHARLDLREARAGRPHHRAAPAETGDGDALAVEEGLLARPGERAAHVAHHLLVMGGTHQRLDALEVLRRGERVARVVAEEELRRGGDVAQLGEAAADVLDVRVDAEHLVDHDHERVAALARRTGHVQGQSLGAGAQFVDDQAGLVGVDRLGLRRQGVGGVARGEQPREAAA